jgi:hypothetical protein
MKSSLHRLIPFLLGLVNHLRLSTPDSESQSESELLFDWRLTAKQFVLATSPLRLTTSNFIFQLITCSYSSYVTPSQRRWVCRLQLLLLLVSAVIVGSETHGTHDHTLLSQIQVSPNLEGQFPVFIYLRNRVARLYPPSIGFPFRRLLRLAGLWWRYSNPPAANSKPIGLVDVTIQWES